MTHFRWSWEIMGTFESSLSCGIKKCAFGAWLHRSRVTSLLQTTMNCASKKKFKKLLKPSRHHLSLGVPANIAVGPLGFQAELDIGPKNKRNPRASRIIFRRDKGSEDQEFPAPEPLTAGAVIRDVNHGDDESGENGGDTGEGEPVGAHKNGTVNPIFLSSSHLPATEGDGEGPTFRTTPARIDAPGKGRAGFGSLIHILKDIRDGSSEDQVPAPVSSQQQMRTKIDDLIPRVAELGKLFTTPPGAVEEMKRRDALKGKLEKIEEQLRPLSENPAGLLEEIREAISDYQMAKHTASYKQGLKSITSDEAAVLNDLRCAQGAEYRHGDRKGCLRGTRTAILDEIEHWSTTSHLPPIYWLNGLAGTGKSTIAQTIAERLFANEQLGASFFCSRDFEDRRNLHLIFPTLAVQLARRYVEYRSIFVPLVRADRGIVEESLYNQMNNLIVQPLRESKISTAIVIDALDECRDDEPASAFLSVLGKLVSEIPNVKFFLTGRPEPRIREGFRVPLLAQATDVFILHEVEPTRVSADIQRFFEHEFSALRDRRRGLDDWPAKEQLDSLCDRAAGLFIYAVATIRFIDHRNKSPKKQLDRLLQYPASSGLEGQTKFKANATLDSLYMSILQDAFSDDDLEDDPKVRWVLATVILAINPLSPSAIAALLGFDTDEVFPILSSIHSLLILDEDVDRPARAFHKSFLDFITDQTRCINERFFVQPASYHSGFLIHCLELMNQRLERNMCKLPEAVVNSEVDDLQARTERYLDQALRYACRSWHKHLTSTTPSRVLKTKPLLHQFLEGKFLCWLEVLSILGAAREAVDALEASARELDASPTLDLVNDYSRFVVAFFEVIKTSAPHIYHSAVPLSPRSSLVRKLYESHASPLARVVFGLSASWGPIVATSYGNNPIAEAVWSPCGRLIGVARHAQEDSGTMMTEVLDGVTLERRFTFETPRDSNQWLGFSPDGRLLTRFNEASELTIWDLQTGGPIGAIPSIPSELDVFPALCFPSPHSIAYSTDGKIVVVACHDPFYITSAISVFDLLSKTYACPYHAPEGHTVVSVWGHCGRLRFATVEPGSITVRETAFTSLDATTKVESSPVPDNFNFSSDTLFHPTLSRLAYTLGKAVLVWDARESKLLLNVQRSNQPIGTSFSSDGRFFACGTTYQQVDIWRESRTGYIPHRTLTSTTHALARPLLSPDGGSIAMLGGSTIELEPTGDPVPSPSAIATRSGGETGFILEFSPDESLAAVARLWDSTIMVLDAGSGESRLVVDAEMKILGLRLTDSTITVVGEGKVINWVLPSGNHTPATRVTVENSVWTTIFDYPTRRSRVTPLEPCTSVSPNFDYIAIAGQRVGRSSGLIIYDVPTGKRLASAETRGLRPWFAPDGSEIWYSLGTGSARGLSITEDSESGLAKFEYLRPTARPLGGLPWKSVSGYEVTNDWWVLSPGGKRLLWLPPAWRSEEVHRKWAGRFLGLSHRELSEGVILELDE